MKWTVQRYVLREVAQTWLAVTGVLVAILLANQLSRVLGQAADHHFGRHVVLDLIALGAIMNLSVVVPVGLLLSIVLALGRLYHDGEMAALQACGFNPARLLPPLFAFAALIAVGLGWLTFVQVPRADHQSQLLRQAALKQAQFGQLDAGRFRSFANGGAVFYAERVDANGVLHDVFLQREAASGRVEVAVANSATYTPSGADGGHIVTLYDGHRYEGVPGHADFRVIAFGKHGIPVAPPPAIEGTNDPDTRPVAELLGKLDPVDVAQLEFRSSSPMMVLLLTLIALPLSRLRPREGRYRRVGVAIVVFFVYSNLLSFAKVWLEKGELSPWIGVWWIHALALALGLRLLWAEGMIGSIPPTVRVMP
ncbi:MAG TPA: LPS export ABC transporter permease LptF [Steroidobacteraceae bacterium]|nr:LPS export ABC transporter permease LptF [Steroidobacteraceae bacterium]